MLHMFLLDLSSLITVLFTFDPMINTDSLFIVCTQSGTVLPLHSAYIVDLSDAPVESYGDDSLTIEYAETNGKPLIQELGL